VELLKEGVVSQMEYDTVKARHDVMQSELENAQQELTIGRTGARAEDVLAQEAKISGFEAELNEAQAAAQDTELRAPFDGVIARTYVNNFEDVQAKQPILSIQDISRININIYVSENDMGRGTGSRAIQEVAKELKAEAVFPSLGGRIFPLIVKEYQTEADRDTQTFELVLQMEQPPERPVMPGMNATVRRQGADPRLASIGILVPVSAVFADTDGSQNVWVVNPESRQVSRRKVKTGDVSAGRIQIVEGLQPGETIAASAVGALAEGMQVAQMSDPREM
jgi:RND family efflux transporter MFP subunit